MSSAFVSVDHLVHRFGRRVALDGVSFDVAEGGMFGVLGPNGSGKTTLFRILATLLRPTAGGARVCGADVVDAPAAVRACLGVVFQSPALDAQLTVAENLRCAGALHGMPRAELRDRLDAVLEALRLAERAGDRVGELSGGLRRRADIARALLPRPRVLLLDEPSAGLDPVARADLARVLSGLRAREGVTVVLTTHLMDEAEGCDRVAVLHRGRLVACEAPAALKARVGGDVLSIACRKPENLAPRVEAFLGIRAAVAGGSVRVELPEAHAAVPRLAGAFPGEIDAVTVARPTLGDVFVHLTEEAWTERD